MLNRVLEAEVMDSAQEAVDYDCMDHAAVNRAFVDDFLIALSSMNAGLSAAEVEILDLGTGTAQIPIELCRRRPDLHMIAVDLAGEMLAVARRNVVAAGLAEQIQLECLDAKDLPFGAGMFSAVISNSIVHHIPRPEFVFAQAVRVLRPKGLLFFRDLLRPADDAAVESLVTRYADGANAHQRKMFDDSLRAALSLDEVRQLVVGLGFSESGVQQTSDRHWTWSATPG